MINEFVYCPRLFYLEWVQSRFVTSHDVEEGLYVHRVVDEPGGNLPSIAESEAWGDRTARSVSLSSTALGIAAKLDLVEGDNRGGVVPVDYKKGRPGPGGVAWPSDRVQSVLQAILLREAGYRCDQAELWYAETRQRVQIVIDDAVVAEVLALLEDVWRVAADDSPPPPLIASLKCPRCSLVGICLPDEVNALRIRTREPQAARRIVPDAPEARPVYVVTQGASVGVRRERLEIFHEGSVAASFRLIDVSQLCLFGNVTVSSQVMRELFAREIPTLWFSMGGWFSGMAEGLPGRNVDLRRAQYHASDEQCLGIAGRMIAGKIRNSRTLLRRNARVPVDEVIEQLGRLMKSARDTKGVPSLLGYEGTAARLYFGQFTSMLAAGTRVDTAGFDAGGRSRRPPKDPVNALLSFCYALLTKDVTTTAYAVGFDPYLGVLHRPRFGRPALALDLAEEFRPLIADSVVLQVLNNGEVTRGDFVQRAGGCQLQPSGRKAVLRAYERRLDQEIRHPHFGYQVSYRRAMEVQARLLAAHLIGDVPEYVPFVTR